MSSEYIYQRKALTLKGRTCNFIALFCLSHSSNTYPHEPNWHLYGLSRQEDALTIPLMYARYADSGVNRGPKGRSITGEYDITQWRDAISKAPVCQTTTQLRFSEKSMWYEQKLSNLAKVVEHANHLGVSLVLNDSVDTFHGDSWKCTTLTLDLSKTSDVDLIWNLTRDGSDSEAKDSYKRLVEPSEIFSSREQWVNESDHTVRLLERPTLQRSKSSWMLNERILKFEFPVDGQDMYKDMRFAVLNWQSQIIATDPECWFCHEVLPLLERKEPGSAESAYKRFKTIMASLPVTSHEGMTIEVNALLGDSEKAALDDWQLKARAKLFERCLKPTFPQAYTDTVKDHLAAFGLADFLICSLALGTGPEHSLFAALSSEAKQLDLIT